MWAHKPAAQQTSPARSGHPINSHAQHIIGEYAHHNLPTQQLTNTQSTQPVLVSIQHAYMGTQSAQYNAAQHYWHSQQQNTEHTDVNFTGDTISRQDQGLRFSCCRQVADRHRVPHVAPSTWVTGLSPIQHNCSCSIPGASRMEGKARARKATKRQTQNETRSKHSRTMQPIYKFAVESKNFYGPHLWTRLEARSFMACSEPEFNKDELILWKSFKKYFDGWIYKRSILFVISRVNPPSSWCVAIN